MLVPDSIKYFSDIGIYSIFNGFRLTYLPTGQWLLIIQVVWYQILHQMLVQVWTLIWLNEEIQVAILLKRRKRFDRRQVILLGLSIENLFIFI